MPNHFFSDRQPTLRNQHLVFCIHSFFVKEAYYHSTEFPSIGDLVRFLHEAWDHPSRDLMIHIADKNLFDNILKNMSAKVIRKHFPQCVAAPAEYMSQTPVPHASSTTEYVPCKVLHADNSKARKHLRAFGNYI